MALAEEVQDGFQGQDRHQVDPQAFQARLAALLAVEENERVAHQQALLLQGGGGMGNAATAGHQVVDDEHALPFLIDAFDGPRLAVVGGLDINQRRSGNQRKRRGQVEAAKGNAGDEIIGRQVRVPHGLEGLHLCQHHVRQRAEAPPGC